MTNSAQNNGLLSQDILLTTTQVCEILKVSRQTIWRFRNRTENPLKSILLGNNVRFKPVDVNAFIETLSKEQA